MLLSDLTLSRQLERTEARANASFVEARAQLQPASGAGWLDVAGTYAMFDGPESPLTQTFGLGLFAEPTGADLEQLEAFFRERGAPVLHEVSPLADPVLIEMLNSRGYQPLEYTTVLYQALDPVGYEHPVANPRLRTRIVGADEAARWADISAEGWSTDAPELIEFIRGLGQLTARSTQPFLAELDGQPIATGSLYLHEGVALVAGASTVPAGRRQGAQAALLYAAEHGATIATMGALPGSQSQRNAEKQGFRIAYTRTKWQLRS
jgi:hypothetical protein